MKKILFVAPIYSPHIDRWYNYFSNLQNVETKLIIWQDYYDTKSILSKIIYVFKIRFILKKIVEEFSPDIINIHTVSFPNYNITKFFREKIVVTPWNGDIIWVAKPKELLILQIFSRRLAILYKKTKIKKLLNKASLITYNSETMKQICKRYLVKEIRLERVQIPGVDTKKWSLRDTKMKLRENLNLPPNDFIILSMRTLISYYNIDIIIRSIPYVLQEDKNVLLVLISQSGKELKAIKRLICNLGVVNHVQIVGKLCYEDMLKYYHTCDIGISISSNDSAPQSVLEAMSTGLPMIVGNIAPLQEIVVNNITGVMVPCRDERILAKEIIRLKNNQELRAKIIINARNRVIKYDDYLFNMKKMERFFVEL